MTPSSGFSRVVHIALTYPLSVHCVGMSAQDSGFRLGIVTFPGVYDQKSTLIKIIATSPFSALYISFPNSAVLPCITTLTALKLTGCVVPLIPVDQGAAKVDGDVHDVDMWHSPLASKETQLLLDSHSAWHSDRPSISL